jgi:hypothetical protein
MDKLSKPWILFIWLCAMQSVFNLLQFCRPLITSILLSVLRLRRNCRIDMSMAILGYHSMAFSLCSFLEVESTTDRSDFHDEHI